MSEQKIDCTYRLQILFDQMEDGTVIPHLIAATGTVNNQNLDVMFYMADIGAPEPDDLGLDFPMEHLSIN